MHATRICWRANASDPTGSTTLLTRWRALGAKAPTQATAEALSLLSETMQCVSATDGQRVAQELLGSRSSSMLIWKTLRRQRVPWMEALILADVQLKAVPSAQERYIHGQSRRRPWSFSRAVLASWDMSPPDMKSLYQSLKQTQTMVQYAQLVTLALRSRPALRQVLPVPAEALRRCYALGAAPDNPGAAAMALDLCQHLALLGQDALTTAKREQLAVAYARLHVCVGDWEMALRVVRASPVVRLSLKEGFAAYVKRRDLWKESLLADQVTAAIAAAPHWFQALAILQRCSTPSTSDADRNALLLRSDAVAGLSWKWALAHFAAIAGPQQRYQVLRGILNSIPVDHPQRIVISEKALGSVAARMYVGTLARRLFTMSCRGEWATAVALACAAECYDIASNLMTSLTPLAYELPHHLVTYEKTVCALKQPLRVPTEASESVASSAEDLSSLPTALAHALHGNWRDVVEAPIGNRRLRTFLSAKMLAEDGHPLWDGDKECHLFADEVHTRLVIAAATEKNRKYFCQVIPTPMRSRIYKGISSNTGYEGHADSQDAKMTAEAFLRGSHTIESLEGLRALFASLEVSLRTLDPPSSDQRGLALLQLVAQCCATGRIQLRQDAYGLAVGVLCSAERLHCRLDARTAAVAFTMVPSVVLDTQPAALVSGVEALSLLGYCDRVMTAYDRWLRKRMDLLPTKVDSSAALVEAFCKVCYHLPQERALAVARRAWQDLGNPFGLILQELLYGDVREVIEILHRDTAKLSNPRVPPSAKARAAANKKNLLSAAFCLLHQEVSLRAVLQTCRQQRVHVEDLGPHAIQRLLRVLPGPAAVASLKELHAMGETVEEFWSAMVAVKADVSVDDLAALSALQRYSLLVNCIREARLGVAGLQPRRTLSALLRYVSLLDLPMTQHMHYPLTFVLKEFCEANGMAAALRADPFPRENQRRARGLYNRLLQMPSLTEVMKRDRKALWLPLKEPEPITPLLLTGYLHHVMNRSQHLPITASFSSLCLRLASEQSHDWMSALYFFKCLRHPNTTEKILLVRALRDTSEATTVLLNTRRFMRDCPEQVLVWCDEASGTDRWRHALRFLEASAEPIAPDAFDEQISQIVKAWNWAECARALELFRRLFSVPVKATVADTQEAQEGDPRTARLVFLVSARQQRCPPPPPDEVKEWETRVPALDAGGHSRGKS